MQDNKADAKANATNKCPNCPKKGCSPAKIVLFIN